MDAANSVGLKSPVSGTDDENDAEKPAMKKLLLSPFLALLFFTAGCGADGKPPVRLPAVAGQFYPGDETKLRRALTHYLDSAVAPCGEKPLAIVVPHAGWVYSGQIAADAFRQAAPFRYDVVVILGTNHTVAPFSGVALYPRGAFRTPLGDVVIDDKIATALMAEDSAFSYRPEAHAREHSVEVQVPFVQQLFPDARIVPGVVGTADLRLCTHFGHELAKALKGKDALIVASSDLSHYPDYQDAVEVDLHTLNAATSLDPARLAMAAHSADLENVQNLSTCACGEGAILTAMVAAQDLGATHGRLISYANSGDAAVGEYDRVVGYGAVIFAAGAVHPEAQTVRIQAADSSAGALTDADKTALLALARRSIEWYLDSGMTPLPRNFDAEARIPQGAFVTLKKHGELRGCVGHMAEDMPLCRTVCGMALMSAFEDQRFRPVTADEMPDIRVEISALTPFKPISGADQIVLGRDGVVIRKSGRSAVFLPQVATEQGWTRDEMLDQLCRKAGLPAGGWRQGAELFTFQAVVFSEPER
jgi:AmmeMemoRadiSam system protein B/AmmeMemoRadiSam system protein A